MRKHNQYSFKLDGNSGDNGTLNDNGPESRMLTLQQATNCYTASNNGNSSVNNNINNTINNEITNVTKLDANAAAAVVAANAFFNNHTKLSFDTLDPKFITGMVSLID